MTTTMTASTKILKSVSGHGNVPASRSGLGLLHIRNREIKEFNIQLAAKRQ